MKMKCDYSSLAGSAATIRSQRNIAKITTTESTIRRNAITMSGGRWSNCPRTISIPVRKNPNNAKNKNVKKRLRASKRKSVLHESHGHRAQIQDCKNLRFVLTGWPQAGQQWSGCCLIRLKYRPVALGKQRRLLRVHRETHYFCFFAITKKGRAASCRTTEKTTSAGM